MIYDLSGDPLLKDIGHDGPTTFSALVLLYISYLDGDAKCPWPNVFGDASNHFI